MKNDKFAGTAPNVASPATGGASVTPHETNDLAIASRAIYVGGDGDLALEMVDGSLVTLAGVKGGSVLPIRVTKVLVSGTTATNIVALW